MFDIGFSELLLFGVIALIVLGPEKLPQAARTAGKWYAKIRRTVSTLQSEIEAELDLAETRQQMQNELAKIRQTEADMKREIAEMRGSMQEFESSQNKELKATPKTTTHQNQAEKKQPIPAEFDYSYEQDRDYPQGRDSQAPATPSSGADGLDGSDTSHDNDVSNENVAKNPNPTIQPIITKPWENMWFRLGAYDKARRLPSPPYLPNYQADILLHTGLNKKVLVDRSGDDRSGDDRSGDDRSGDDRSGDISANTIAADTLTHQPNKPPSLHKQEVD